MEGAGCAEQGKRAKASISVQAIVAMRAEDKIPERFLNSCGTAVDGEAFAEAFWREECRRNCMTATLFLAVLAVMFLWLG